MSSFYGNGISIKQVEDMININMEKIKNHIIISKTEPVSQQTGDIWFVLTQYSEQEQQETG